MAADQTNGSRGAGFERLKKRIASIDSEKEKDPGYSGYSCGSEYPLKAPSPTLPPWPDFVRVVPNCFLRSSLFGAIGKGKRSYIDGEQIVAQDGIEIRYNGQRLDQGDLSVWESVLHSVRMQELGSQCRLTSYALLKLMGKTDTGPNRATLKKHITRLVGATLAVKHGRYEYTGTLIASAAKDEETQEWIIQLNDKLLPLFAADQFTQVEWAVRHTLDGKPLAQWLQGFYSSHAAPFPLKIETLHRLCGSASDTEHPWKFRQTLKKALDAVANANKACGKTFSYTIENGLVTVKKCGTGTQRRHLSKKAADARAARASDAVPAGRPMPLRRVGDTVVASRPYRCGE